MANATDVQVQAYADKRVRKHAQLATQLLAALQDDIASIDDVYNALNVQSPTWADNRTDGPPHLLTPSDVLAFNTFMHDIVTALSGHAQWPIVLKAAALPDPG